MVHSLVPFELLDWENYEKYYEGYINADNNTNRVKITSHNNHHFSHLLNHNYNDIESLLANYNDIDIPGVTAELAHASLEERKEKYQNLNNRTYYYTSCNKIWNQMYYFLFVTLLGSHKTTRYQHMLAFTSEFYLHNAFVLKSTPRTLYGTDPGEHYNDKVKSLVHKISNKFMRMRTNLRGSKLPPTTLMTVMRYCIWEYYNVREKNVNFDTKCLQQKLKILQQKQDIETLERPAKICSYFTRQEVNFNLHIHEFDEITEDYNNLYQYDNDNNYIYQHHHHQTSEDYSDSANDSDVVGLPGDNQHKVKDNIQSHRLRYSWNLRSNLDTIEYFINRQRQTDQLLQDNYEC